MTLGLVKAPDDMATTLLRSGADGVMRCGMSQMLDLLSPNPQQVPHIHFDSITSSIHTVLLLY